MHGRWMAPRRATPVSLLLATIFAAPPAQADPPAPPPTSTAAPEAPQLPDDPNGDDVPDVEPVDLREQVRSLEIQLAQTQRTMLEQRPAVTIGAYIDFGAFAAQGDGSGVMLDTGPTATRHFPQYADRYGWVIMGDLLSPAVNSRGEPADLGNLPGVNRFDSIDSNGAPGFIVNEVNLAFQASMGESAIATASVDFMPRTGSDFAVGDFFEVDLAQVEWMPTESRRTSIFVGKMDSVLGIEYRDRKASQRFGVTPSLIARYTTGTPLGLKVRSKFGPNNLFVVAAAITNGSSVIETFHFQDEVDSNAGKTASGRLSVAPPLPFGLELGVSGLYGPQDRALDSEHAMWFAGADLQLHFGRVDFKGQYLIGRAPGETDQVYDPKHRPYGLSLNNGAYLEMNAMVTPWFGVLARGDLRDALVWLGNPDAPGGADRIYVTKSWRATAGVRVVPNQHVIIKAEYLHNGEFGGVPAIRNDVLTSSLVLVY
jgi:hypothetical protein